MMPYHSAKSMIKHGKWVHIADVSNYVSENSALDREAKKRGNSTYLVGEVVPCFLILFRVESAAWWKVKRD